MKKQSKKRGAGRSATSVKKGGRATVAAKKKSAKKKGGPVRGSSTRRRKKSSAILVVAGEHSGDLLGGDLVHALKSFGHTEFFGTGGEKMAKQGVELVESVETMNVVGFVEALGAYRRLKRLAATLADQAVARNVRLAILIDYPGFNLHLARLLKERGIRVAYYVSPQIWAWKYGRIKTIKRYVDLMLVLFPFEKELYQNEGVRVEFVSHPLVKRIPKELAKQPKIASFSGTTIALLPGSRASEVARHLPVLLDSAVQIASRLSGKVRFVIPNVNPTQESFIADGVSRHPGLKIEIVSGGALRAMEGAKLVILSSGTATLEAAFFKKPMIIIYKSGLINFLIASVLMRTRYIGLVNILSDSQAALELLQSEATSENITAEAIRILTDKQYSKTLVEKITRVIEKLGRGNPAGAASKAIDALLGEIK